MATKRASSSSIPALKFPALGQTGAPGSFRAITGRWRFATFGCALISRKTIETKTAARLELSSSGRTLGKHPSGYGDSRMRALGLIFCESFQVDPETRQVSLAVLFQARSYSRFPSKLVHRL